MKTKVKQIALVLALSLLLCGCGGEPDRQGMTVTDDLGRTVMVGSADRVAALIGSFADVWMLAGGTVIAAPDDAWEDFGLELPEDAVNLGGTKDKSLEALLAARPDLILASANTRQDLEWQETLESTGIPTLYFNVSNFDDYLRMLKICTEITGRDDLYQKNGMDLQLRIDQSIARSESMIAQTGHAPTVLVLRASAGSIRAKNSKDNVLGEMLAALGCVNIADSDESLLENVSMEHILLSDPDHIFVVQLGDDTAGTEENLQRFFDENPVWYSLRAVKQNRVHTMEKRMFNLKPNALWADAYEILEEIVNG